MRQNNLTYSKVFALAFAIITIIALILYFLPDKQPLNWLTLDEAKTDALKFHKPILVNFYSRWSAECKNADKTIFSNDTLKLKLRTNYILARVSLDSKTNKFLAKEIYDIKGLPALVELSPKGEETMRISAINPFILSYWIQDTTYKTIDSWQNYYDAKSYAEKNNKILIIFLVTKLNQSGFTTKIISDNKVQLLIAQDYVPVYIIASNVEDRKIINNLFGSLNSAPYGEVLLFYYKGKELDSYYLSPELFTKPELLYNKLLEVTKKKSNM
jgi:hypothetical protein